MTKSVVYYYQSNALNSIISAFIDAGTMVKLCMSITNPLGPNSRRIYQMSLRVGSLFFRSFAYNLTSGLEIGWRMRSVRKQQFWECVHERLRHFNGSKIESCRAARETRRVVPCIASRTDFPGEPLMNGVQRREF